MKKNPFHTDGLHDLLLPGDVAADQSTELGASADASKKIGVQVIQVTLRSPCLVKNATSHGSMDWFKGKFTGKPHI